MSNRKGRPDALDAVVAAPAHHKLLFENESVRVLDTSIAPGETTPLHTHRWPATLYILKVSHFVRRDENGAIILDSRAIPPIAAGTALWSSPLGPHTLENVGQTQLHVIAVELKQRTTSSAPPAKATATRRIRSTPHRASSSSTSSPLDSPSSKAAPTAAKPASQSQDIRVPASKPASWCK